MIITSIVITLNRQEHDKQETTPEIKILVWDKTSYTWKCEEGFWPAELTLLTEITAALKKYNGASK
jgi:hypothetical protein